MSRTNDRELAGLFDEAERVGSCLVVSDPRLRMAARRRMGEGGEIVSPRAGIYARRATWEGLDPPGRSLAVMRALQSQHDDWVFCGPSAAIAFGADVSWRLLDSVHLVAPSRSWHSAPGLARHDVRMGAYSGEGAVWRSGVRVTPLARTTFDCLRWMSFRDGMVVADWVLGGRPGRRASLGRYFESLRGECRGVSRALGTLAHADGRAESGGESIARAVMIERGYMLPDLQVSVPDPLRPGRFFRVDFVWVRADGRVIVGECDGRGKIVDPELNGGRTPEQALEDQRSREGLITAYDVSVLRFTYGEAAGEKDLVSKLDLYGVPKAGSALALAGEPPRIDWQGLLRK